MSKVLPFRGLLPKREFVKEVASPPYDVIDSDEARRRTQNNPNSFLHVIKPEVDLDPAINPYDPLVYQKAKENLSALISRGVLYQLEKPCFYIYKQIMGNHQQTGLVACVAVDEYLNGQIRKHEHTQEEKVRDRINLIQTLNAQTGPVFLIYRNNERLSGIFQQCTQIKPIYDFVADHSVRHIFYVIDNDELIQNFQEAFEEIDYLYIADGHHRSEAAAQVCLLKRAENPKYLGNEEYNFFLAVIFPHSEMSILPCNRIIKSLNGYSTSEFIEKVQQRFSLNPMETEFFQPTEPHIFGMYIDNKWYAIKLKDEYMNFSNPVESLDVSILQKYLFEPILNITNPRRDKRLEFVGGLDSVQKVKQLVDSGKFALGFSLYPITIEQIMEVADAGLVMPPKSTWFEPKLLSGLVTHLLD